jgi:hypothetical protein
MNMTDSIKITSLNNIGSNILYTTLVPVVDMSGTPTTKKANLQIVGNLILNGAGGSYFPPAAQAILAQSVTNAAQPNITSVGTLSTLTVNGNLNGNIINANVFSGNGSALTGILGANISGNVNSALIAYSVSASNVTGLGNISTINLDGNSSNVLYGNGVFAAGGGLTLPIANGNSNINIATDGNITITSNIGNTWTFNTSGDLELPGNIIWSNANSRIETLANSSGDGLGYSTLRLIPDNTLVASDQYLIIDPTVPSHIHIRAGGTQDSSTAELFLGGEENHINIINGSGSRLYHEVRRSETYNYSTGVEFTNGAWINDSGTYYVEFTTTDPGMEIQSFNLTTDPENEVEVYDGGDYYILSVNGVTNLGGNVYRIFVNEQPVTTPIPLQQINYTLFTTEQNYLEVRDRDFRVEVNDDVTISGKDRFRLINGALDEGIEIITDNTDNAYTWLFGFDGNLTLPTNNISINYNNGLPVFGNIVGVSLDGNASNVLAGNGTFVSPWSSAPTANNDPGIAGQIAYDVGGNLYICVAANTWSKIAGTTSW